MFPSQVPWLQSSWRACSGVDAAAELFIIIDKLDLARAHLIAAQNILSGKKMDPMDAAKINFIGGLIAARQGDIAQAIALLQSVDQILPEVSAWRFSDRATVFDELAKA